MSFPYRISFIVFITLLAVNDDDNKAAPPNRTLRFHFNLAHVPLSFDFQYFYRRSFDTTNYFLALNLCKRTWTIYGIFFLLFFFSYIRYHLTLVSPHQVANPQKKSKHLSSKINRRRRKREWNIKANIWSANSFAFYNTSWLADVHKNTDRAMFEQENILQPARENKHARWEREISWRRRRNNEGKQSISRVDLRRNYFRWLLLVALGNFWIEWKPEK
jgi:hypothetical protein